jgi:hypothetical protein
MDAMNAEAREAMPARTLLAPLQPLGLGTPYVESLSSYFQRLADLHSISPKLLAREFVLPRLGVNNRVGEVQADRYWRSPFFSGMGEMPLQWCQALGELTGVANLHRLTLLPLHGLIGLKGCSSEARRWCPCCLRESEAEGRPHGQLLWEIGCVMACPKHGIRLMSMHGCGADEAIPPLRIKPLPHLCRGCGRSLGLVPTTGLEPAGEVEVRFAKTVGELLASSLFAEGPRDPGRTIADFLFDAIQSYEGGSGIAAVHRIGASKGQVSDWLYRRHLPSLPQAAAIANAYKAELPEILVGRGGIHSNLHRWGRAPRPTSFRHYKRRYMVNNLEAKLRKLLTEPNPPSEAEAASMLGTSSRELRRLHPELARALAERHAEWRSQEAGRQRQERLQVVKELVDQMVCEGAIPTMARLEQRLIGIPKSFLFKERVVCKRICERAKADLGT